MSTTSKPLLYLSEKRTVFVGQLPARQLTNRSFADALYICLDGTTHVHDSARKLSTEGKSFLVPAGYTVSFSPEGKNVAVVYLDAIRDDWTVLRQSMIETVQLGDAEVGVGLPNEEEVIRIAAQLMEQRPGTAELFDIVDTWLGGHPSHDRPLDDRIEHVLRRVKSTFSENLSVDDLAAEVELSESRLIQLFKQTVGVPIRSYRMWFRLFIAVVMIGKGQSITDAAFYAGFTDSSQFSRQFKRIIGMAPSELLGVTAQIDVRVCPQLTVVDSMLD